MMEFSYIMDAVYGALGFFGGRFLGRRDKKREVVNDRVEVLIDSIGQITKDAIYFFTTSMDERETAQQTALIGRAFKRLNTDLHSICCMCGKRESEFLDVNRAFYDAVTGDPFGASRVDPVGGDDDRIMRIQDAEDRLIKSVKSLEQY